MMEWKPFDRGTNCEGSHDNEDEPYWYLNIEGDGMPNFGTFPFPDGKKSTSKNDKTAGKKTKDGGKGKDNGSYEDQSTTSAESNTSSSSSNTAQTANTAATVGGIVVDASKQIVKLPNVGYTIAFNSTLLKVVNLLKPIGYGLSIIS